MKHTLKQVFGSTRFVIGFAIFMFILLTVIIYPLFVRVDPLGIIGEGTFFPPGVYVSVFDSLDSKVQIFLMTTSILPNMTASMAKKLSGNQSAERCNGRG